MKQLKIGIAGAGGLGSNVALNLVRSGIDAFRIVDFDCVEAFDKAAAKKMLMEGLAGDQLVVSASGVAGGSLDGIHWRQFGRAHIVGDFVSDCADWPLFSHKVVTVASHMSAFVLKEMGAFS